MATKLDWEIIRREVLRRAAENEPGVLELVAELALRVLARPAQASVPPEIAGVQDMPEYDYAKVVGSIRETVAARLPRETKVAVAGVGDEDLLQLGPRQAWHVPAAEDGTFLGGHPADSEDAIQHLERARALGAEYFLLPAPQFWWRDHYANFNAHLKLRHQLIFEGEDCAIYKLLAPPPPAAGTRLDMLSRIRWQPDRFLLDDLVFWIQTKNEDVCEIGDECFHFYKGKPLVDLYADFWAARGHVPVRNLVELGIWGGGSCAFWFEFFRPDKHVALDLLKLENRPYFDRYRQRQGIEARLATYWGVDQGDAAHLSSIMAREFTGPIDLVIDDASHLYGPTRRCFETLFPRLRPGGLYIIEDWAWEHWPEFHAPDHVWAKERGLTDLVNDLVCAIGTPGGLIQSMAVCQGFVAVERGATSIPLEGFNLGDHMIRRPPPLVAGCRNGSAPSGNGSSIEKLVATT
jgi:hypothetical protein